MVPGFPIAHLAAAALGLGASWCDIRTRRIPNVLTFGGALLAALHAVATGGGAGILICAAGWCAGLVVFLPLYLLRGMGAGDVKLMACLGAWIGPWLALTSALYAAIAGGVMAVVVGLASGYLAEALLNVQLLLSHWRSVGPRPLAAVTLEHARGPRLPYALPITAGTLVAIWPW